MFWKIHSLLKFKKHTPHSITLSGWFPFPAPWYSVNQFEGWFFKFHLDPMLTLRPQSVGKQLISFFPLASLPFTAVLSTVSFVWIGCGISCLRRLPECGHTWDWATLRMKNWEWGGCKRTTGWVTSLFRLFRKYMHTRSPDIQRWQMSWTYGKVKN